MDAGRASVRLATRVANVRHVKDEKARRLSGVVPDHPVDDEGKDHAQDEAERHLADHLGQVVRVHTIHAVVLFAHKDRPLHWDCARPAARTRGEEPPHRVTRRGRAARAPRSPVAAVHVRTSVSAGARIWPAVTKKREAKRSLMDSTSSSKSNQNMDIIRPSSTALAMRTRRLIASRTKPLTERTVRSQNSSRLLAPGSLRRMGGPPLVVGRGGGPSSLMLIAPALLVIPLSHLPLRASLCCRIRAMRSS